MLGSAVCQVLPDARGVSRRAGNFDIDADLDPLVQGYDWIVNAVGVTKPMAQRDDLYRVNTQFPRALANAAERSGARVIQIATDGVFSGARGSYKESDPHDATDDYGRSKSLGEVQSPAVLHLRCSIIGPEPHEPRYLLEWLRRQPQSAIVPGFTNHLWNGITTLHFARILTGIVRGVDVPPVQHVIPAGVITKANLLRELARAYGRTDLRIEDVEAPEAIDRTLITERPDVNAALWRAAGYHHPPAIPQMIDELAH